MTYLYPFLTFSALLNLLIICTKNEDRYLISWKIHSVVLGAFDCFAMVVFDVKEKAISTLTAIDWMQYERYFY